MNMKTGLAGIRARLSRPRLSTLSGAADRLVQGWQLADAGTLTLRLPQHWPQSDGEIRWWWRPASGRAQHGVVARLEDLPVEMRSAKVVAWTPAEDTLLTSARLPTRTRARILQALPYALEEQLVEDPESQHFAYRPRPDGSLAVAVTARSQLDHWLAAIRAAGMRLSALCPAVLALPWSGAGWVLAAEGEEGYVRTGPFSGFACPPPWKTPPAVLAVALREAHQRGEAPAELVVWDPPPGFDRDAWVTALGLPVTVQTGWTWDAVPVEPPFNLLQGELAPVGELRQLLAPLRPAAIALAAGLAASLLLGLWEWGSLAYTERRQRTEMSEIFRSTFPEVKTVVDPVLQMERNLGALQASSGRFTATDLLAMLSRFGDVIHGNPQVKIRAMQYAEAGVTLDLQLPDFNQMEVVKNALQRRGMRVEVLSANSRSGGVESRLRLKLERRL